MPLKDREARVAWQREHYQKNKPVIARKAKEYRARNQEKIRDARKRYRAANREKIDAANSKWAKANPDKTAEYRRRSYRRHHATAVERSYNRCLAKQYGLTREQYDAMAAKQNGRCAICGGPPSKRVLGVDHDHATGRVRGLLCHKCNIFVGYLETSPTDIVERISRYLGES